MRIFLREMDPIAQGVERMNFPPSLIVYCWIHALEIAVLNALYDIVGVFDIYNIDVKLLVYFTLERKQILSREWLRVGVCLDV